MTLHHLATFGITNSSGLDPQANLTMCMGHNNPDEIPITTNSIFENYLKDKTMDKKDYILEVEGCDLIPSSILLAGVEPQIINAYSREYILKAFITEIADDYDYILIDCMPSLGMLTINALVAATDILIPMQAHYLSAKGLEMLLTSVSKIRKSLNPQLRLMGILLTMYNERLNFNKSMLASITESYGKHINIFENKIPHSVRAVENTAAGESLFLYDPKCKVALAYEAFTKEVITNA